MYIFRTMSPGLVPWIAWPEPTTWACSAWLWVVVKGLNDGLSEYLKIIFDW
jgi:hypothetical protein